MADNYTVQVTLKGANQLSQPVNQAQQSLRGLNQEAGRVNQTFNQIKGMAAGMFAGVAIAGAVRFGEELYQTGMEAQRAGNLFRSFGAQVGDTDGLLARLRTTTRGVVTDIDLMNAANSMLSMGLAKSATDVERLTNIGVTFAQAMGEDVGASLQNLNMILANQSYLRLDSLGISSSQVRELANQYKAAGMDSSEAFNAAFLDVAEGKLPQMAAVADATVTPFQELQTSMNNFMADFGNNFAVLLNGMAEGVRDLAELIGGIFGGGTTSGIDAQSILNAQTVAGTYAGLYTGGGNPAGMLSSSNITGAITAAILADQAGMDAGSAEFLNLLTTNAFGYSSNDSLFSTDAGQQMLQQAAAIVGWYETYMGVVNAATSGATEAAVTGRGPLPTRYSGNAIQDIVARGDRSSWGSMYGNAGMYFDQLSFMANSGGGRLFSPEEVGIARDLANEVQRSADMLENLGLSDAIVNPMQEAAKQAAAMADNIERSNVAMVSMSELFGQTSGGQFDEINQAVLSQMRANGATAEQLAAAEQQMGMRSGTMTGMSVQFGNTVSGDLADVYTQLGPEAYFQLQQAYLQFVRDMRTQSPDFNGAVPWDLIMRDAGISQQQGSAYTVQAGDTVWGLAQAAGMSVQDYMNANGLSSSMLSIGQQIGSTNQYSWDPTAITTAMDSAATDSGTINDNMTTAVDTLQSGLNDIFGRTYTLNIDMAALKGAIATAISGNGGTPPGSSPYVGKSGTGATGSRGTMGKK